MTTWSRYRETDDRRLRCAALRHVSREKRMKYEVDLNECIEWDGSLEKRNGAWYGRLGVKRTAKNVEKYYLDGPADPQKDVHLRMHRVVWMENYGRIPKGLVVRHKCDNPPCVNIEHLELGTHADNRADMHRRGRYVNGMARKLAAMTHCKRGHEYPPERGMCKKCKNYTRQLWREERKRLGLKSI